MLTYELYSKQATLGLSTTEAVIAIRELNCSVAVWVRVSVWEALCSMTPNVKKEFQEADRKYRGDLIRELFHSSTVRYEECALCGRIRNGETLCGCSDSASWIGVWYEKDLDQLKSEIVK